MGPLQPPRRTNFAGAPRHVGVEIEFAALTAEAAAHAIVQRFGGEVAHVDPHRFEVRGARYGTFKAELDSKFAHPQGYFRLTDEGVDDGLDDVRRALSRLFGDLGAVVIPCEIVAPPVPIEALPELDALVDDLRAQGARGSGDSVFYAFGLHLNPDAASLSPEWIVDVMRAEMLLSDWLRRVMVIDPTRALTGFAPQFPDDFVRLVLAPGYRREITGVRDDYITHNPTRDRELDLLPLLAWIDEAGVRGRLPHEKIGRRPAFHFRLPNAALDQADWSITREWNRWWLVEMLAENRPVAAAMAARHLDNLDAWLPEDWALRSSAFLVELLAEKYHFDAVS
ncbi:MAG: amidoligase family protein [Hyphomicrobiaceae bacterium]